MLQKLSHFLKICRIGFILARNDALFPDIFLVQSPILKFLARVFSHRNPTIPRGQRLSRALQQLGPSFIKLGQTLSTRPDLVGQDIAEDLADLQDRVPPFPTALAKATIEKELGRPVSDLFISFEDTPVAAASIAQVHFALFQDPYTGLTQSVAVKVLRPGIEEAFQEDLAFFYWIADTLERRYPRLKRLRLKEVVDLLTRTVQIEMDLRMEAAAASELAENFIGDTTFCVPRIIWDRTSQRVLTSERIVGIPVDETVRLREAGFDPDKILRLAAITFFKQVFRDGFFHADLHAGNLFVNPQGTLTAVDFGIMGRLDRPTRYFLADMLVGFLKGDYKRVAEVHFDAGFVPAHQDIDTFTQALRAIGEPLLKQPLKNISIGRLLSQLFAVTEQFQMETQPQLLLLQKSMLTAEGIGRVLNPEVNMWEMAREPIEEWMRENRGLKARLLQDARDIRQSLSRFPTLLKEVEKTLIVLQYSHSRPPVPLGWPHGIVYALCALLAFAVALLSLNKP